MKRLYTLCALFLYMSAVSAQGFEFDSIGVQSITIGKITQKADTWVIRVDRAGGYDDYWPVNLPESYAIQGQEVVFEGARGRIPVNARLVGTPVKLHMIRVLYRTQPADADGETLPKEELPTKTIDPDSTGYIDKQHGKIIQITDVYFIESVINGEVKRYVPDYLPDDFKIAGSDITFSAVTLKYDPQVRMLGAPVRIKELMMEEQVAFDETLLQEQIKDMYPFDSVGYLQPVKGIVKLIADVYVIEVMVDGHMTRYLPAILPKEFQQAEKAVIISGTIGKIPANARLMGTPLTLDEIKND